MPADGSDSVFRGGDGWNLGHKEETCMFDAHRVTVLRRKISESNLDDVNCIQWCFEEDDDRVGLHDEAHGKWVPFSRRLSTMLESHHLVYVDGRGKAQFVVTVESDRKHVHLHTGLQYEIDLAQSTQKNVMTGYQRRLLRRDMEDERQRLAQCVIQGDNALDFSKSSLLNGSPASSVNHVSCVDIAAVKAARALAEEMYSKVIYQSRFAELNVSTRSTSSKCL